MSYKKQGKLWPTENDRTPKTTRFHVPCSRITDESYNPQKQAIEITETTVNVEERLAHQFILYRVAKFIRNNLKLSRREGEHEV